MTKKYTLALSAVGLLWLSGCSSANNYGPNLAVEPTSTMTKQELTRKHLHTHSLMQTLQHLGQKQGFRTTFSSNSDDMFLSGGIPDTWFDAIMLAQNSPGTHVTGDVFAGKGAKTKRLTIKDNTRSVYTGLAKHFTTPYVIQGEKFSGKYIIKMDRSTKKLLKDARFSGRESISMERFFNKLSGVAQSEGKQIYFNLRPKGNIFTVSSSPTFHSMTPYKRQFFVNFLNAAGIGYIANGNSVAIKDNLTGWERAMNKLHRLNKYHNAVYAIHDGRNWFEVSDSSYQKAPITVELIDWVPGGVREYNIYSHGFNRKIETTKRFIDWYLPDGSKKYTIRFY